ncbi:hypothetical protein [Hyphomonas sp.]|uniref:hypothetical protein n=1 Tax=Hyphomonas sp. TaxID=87 RepID=UPI0025BE4FD9|nr:hypothetical protein [Hyphomonas sp.]
MRTLLLAFLVSASAAMPAHACYSIKVKNETDRTLDVAWGALECGKKWRSEDGICDHEEILHSDDFTMKFGWGMVAPTVYINFAGSDTDAYTKHYYNNRMMLIYNLHGDKFKKESVEDLIPASPSTCGKHYTITYTSKELRSDWAGLKSAAAKEAAAEGYSP